MSGSIAGSSSTKSVSADGSVIAGNMTSTYSILVPGEPVANSNFTFSLNPSEGERNFESFPRLPQVIHSKVQEAFRWTKETGMTKLWNVNDNNADPFQFKRSFVNAISDDGVVIVGHSSFSRKSDAFRWTEEKGMEFLDGLPDSRGSVAHDVNGDGSVIVGSSTVQIIDSENVIDFGNILNLWPFSTLDKAFIWDSVNKTRELKYVLESEYGLDLTGWSLEKASGMSADGLVIVGSGVNPDGRKEAWMANLSKKSINGCRKLIKPSGEVKTIGYCSKGSSRH